MGRFGTSIDIGSELKEKEADKTIKPDISIESLESKLLEKRKKKIDYKYILAGVFCFLLALFMLTQTYEPNVFKQLAEQELKDTLGLEQYVQVSKEYPEWSADQKRVETNARIEKFLKTDEGKELSKKKKKELLSYFQDENGEMYIYNADSYYFLRLTKNLIERNHLGTNAEIKTIDELRSVRAISGYIEEVTFTLFPYFVKWWYTITSPVFSLNQAAFSFPILLGILFLLVIFITVYSLKKEIWLSIIVIFFIIAQPMFSKIFSGGNPDTEVISVFFSALILMCTALIATESKATKILSILILAVIIKLYQYTWSGWKYIIAVFLLAGIFLSLIKAMSTKNKRSVFIFMFITFVCIALLSSSLKNLSTAFLDRLVGTDIGRASYSRFISELQPLSFELAKTALGGYSGIGLFVIIFMGMIFVFIKNIKKPSFFELTISVLFFSTLIVSLFASRFLPYLFLGYIFAMLITLRKLAQYKKIISPIIILCSLIIITSAYITANKTAPFMHDGIVETGEFLKTTKTNSTILTWWDRGYMWQYAGERPTYFDGATFDVMGVTASNIFTTLNPVDAAYLLSIITCNGRDFWAESIFKKDIDDNSTPLIYIKETANLFAQTCPIDVYLIADQHSFSFINTLYIYANQKHFNNPDSKELLLKKLKYGGAYAEKSYGEISDMGIPTLTSPEKCIQSKKYKLICSDFIVDTDQLIVEKPKKQLRSLIFVQKGKKTKKEFENSNSDNALVIYWQGGEYYSFIANYYLLDGLLLRLFIGEDIPRFERVYEVYTPERILTFKLSLDT